MSREIDALVATAIFNYTLDYEFADTMDGPCVRELRDQYDEWGVLPAYSVDMAAAWLVVERMRDDGWRMELKVLWPSNRYGVQFSDSSLEFAATAPIAICLAALKALNVEVSAGIAAALET